MGPQAKLLEEAIDHAKFAVDGFEKACGPTHYFTFEARGSFASCLKMTSERRGEAKAYTQNLYADKVLGLGHLHPSTLKTMEELATGFDEEDEQLLAKVHNLQS